MEKPDSPTGDESNAVYVLHHCERGSVTSKTLIYGLAHGRTERDLLQPAAKLLLAFSFFFFF